MSTPGAKDSFEDTARTRGVSIEARKAHVWQEGTESLLDLLCTDSISVESRMATLPAGIGNGPGETAIVATQQFLLQMER
jgi:hypothetical protein